MNNIEKFDVEKINLLGEIDAQQDKILEYEYEVKNIKTNEIYNVKYLLDVEIDDDDHDINTKYELATDDCSDDLVYFLKQHES